MSRRSRALAFLLLALLAAAVAAAIADGYGASAVRGYGPLRPVTADGFSLRPPSMLSAFIRFTRDERQQVTGFSLSTNGCKNIRFVKSAE